MNVIVEIARERERQIGSEGFTDGHDDAHRPGTLAFAACAYALTGAHFASTGKTDWQSFPPPMWPGDWGHWWKPKNARRDLVRAAALIVAEIERLDRAAKEK